jgi:hypothetical protein
MNPSFVIVICSALFFYSCKGTVNRSSDVNLNVVKNKAAKATENTTSPKPLRPVFGYRFVITGNFDGSGKIDTLTEHFFSALTHKETNKFYEDADYDQLVDSGYKKKTYCFISSSNKHIESLPIETKPQFGLSYLKNEGDLTGDGTDDISFVVNYADWSSVNFCIIMAYKKGKWQRIFSFEIRDSQLPELPQVNELYGPFGLQDAVIDEGNYPANKLIEKRLKAFGGLIKKISNNNIRVIGSVFDANGDMHDTVFVNLKTHQMKSVSNKLIESK